MDISTKTKSRLYEETMKRLRSIDQQVVFEERGWVSHGRTKEITPSDVEKIIENELLNSIYQFKC